MTRRDDAIEAAARALWDTGGTDWNEANADERHYHRDCAEVALNAALAVLHPTIPNTVEALHDLPIGTVIRSDEDSVAERAEGYWWVTGVEAWWATRQLTGVVITSTPTAWTVLWWGDNNDKEAA